MLEHKKDYDREMLEKLVDYLKHEAPITIDKNNQILDYNHLLKNSTTDLSEWFKYNINKIYKILPQIIRDQVIENENMSIVVNIIPSQAMTPIDLSHMNYKYENMLLRIEGTVIGLFDIRTYSKYYVTCPCCYKSYTITRKPQKCVYCKVDLYEKDYITEKKTERAFLLKEHKDNTISSETIKCIVDITELPEHNIIDFSNIMGTKVELSGFLIPETRMDMIEKKEYNTYYFRVLGVTIKTIQNLKNEQIQRVKDFIELNDEMILEIIANDVYGNIYGYEYIKKCLLITAIGLKPKDNHEELKNKSKQMCTILISDAGKSKTTMAKQIMKFLPNSGYVGANASKAGLTIGIDKTQGENIISLGVVPTCHNSICVIDEFNKIGEELDALLTAISDGVIKITKIKRFEMDVHINYILLGNPINGYFDLNSTYYSQINLSPPFIDRADFICVLIPEYDSKDDEQVNEYMNAISGLHYYDRITENDTFLSELIYYLKHYPENPGVDREIHNYINKTFLKIRTITESIPAERKSDVKRFEERAYISFYKMVKVIARMKLKKMADKRDVDQAFDIYYNACVKPIFYEYNQYDISSFSHTLLSNQNKRMIKSKKDIANIVINTINYKGEVTENHIVDKCVDLGASAQNVRDIILKLKESGDIFEPQNGVFKAVITTEPAQEFVQQETAEQITTIQEKIMEAINNNGTIEYDEIIPIAKKLNIREDIIDEALSNLENNAQIIKDKNKYRCLK